MDSAIQMANERMVYVTGDKEAIRAYERRQMALSDHTSYMNYARGEGLRIGREEGHKQGLAEGREEGRNEGRNEERQRLLEMFNSGLSIEEIKRRLNPNV